MDLKKYQHFSLEELVDNSDFRAWILLPSEEKKQLWQAYIKANPEEGIKLENAKKVVLGLDNYYQKELPLSLIHI